MATDRTATTRVQRHFVAGALALAACGPARIGDGGIDPAPCPEPIVDLELGIYETCLLGESGRLRCFGSFSWLDEWLADEAPLWEVPWTEFPSPPIFVSNSGGRVCVLLEDGRFECVLGGVGFTGEVVDLNLEVKPVAIFRWGTAERLLLADGRLVRVPENEDGEVELEDTPGPLVQFAAAPHHHCAVTQAGAVACAGFNTYSPGGTEFTGALGVPGVAFSEKLILLPVTGAVGVATGMIHTCAWFETGEYACWGVDTSGLLGDGTSGGVIGDDETLDDLERHALDGAVVQIRANAWATCARLDDGGVRCWGDGRYVQLPRYNFMTGSTTTVADPLSEPRIPLPEPAIDIDLGKRHACAVGESGAVYCWGSPPRFGETNSWSLENGGYLDPVTGLVKPMQLEDPEACEAG